MYRGGSWKICVCKGAGVGGVVYVKSWEWETCSICEGAEWAGCTVYVKERRGMSYICEGEEGGVEVVKGREEGLYL